MTDALHLTDVSAAGRDQLILDVRPVHHDDRAYVRASWRETHKLTKGYDRMPWPVYKVKMGRVIDAVLDRDDVKLLGAYWPDGRVAGWIAYTPGRSVSTVHWTLTRVDLDGAKLRRRGIMTELLEHAGLGRRLAYTFRAPGSHRNGSRRASRGTPLDETLVQWLASRGVSAAYIPIEEWTA